MQGITARVKYHKTGLIRLIGHLDTARALMRAVKRAGIEGVYSQGFSPRLRLSFGPPLPLGCTSQCEFFDIRLAGMCDPDSVKQRLQQQFPEGLAVEEVQVLEGDAPAVAKAFWATEYDVEVPPDCPVKRSTIDQLNQAETSATGGTGDAGQSATSPGSHVARAKWEKTPDGGGRLTVVLRHDSSGKGGLKEIISRVLGVHRENLTKCIIHKRRVYAKGEHV
jgi:radical SAM-linked protein